MLNINKLKTGPVISDTVVLNPTFKPRSRGVDSHSLLNFVPVE